jgi:AcrR family transcriptional regulator
VTQERAVRTRALVLAAAAEEFSAHGYQGTTLLDVVKRTGMTKGALYGHFSSKEELAATLIVEAGDELIARVTRGAGHGSTALHALRETILDLTRYLHGDALARSALRLAVEAPQLDPRTLGLVEQICLPLTSTVAQAQADDRAIARYPPEAIARLLMSVFLAIPYPLPSDDADAKRRFDALWEAMSGPPQGGVPPSA